MSLRRAVLLLLAASCLLGSAACSPPRAAGHPGAPLVVVSIDTLRADHLPAYGYRGVETPALDRFRRDAVLFENAYTHAPLTLPAHVSLFTGRLPFEHGVRDNLGYRLDPRAHPTLAALLRARGYATAAAVSAYVLRGATGLADGFDVYEDHIAAPGGVDALGRVQRGGRETLERIAPWLDAVHGRPFFLFFHVYEPHAPYDAPAPFKQRYALPYDAEVAASDAVVGELLERLRRLGVYDRALVIVLSDHGEGLGEHGEDEHGILLYRWALHVPLLVKLPGASRGGSAVGEPVALVDVLPTVTDLLGVAAPRGSRGRSLFAGGPRPDRVYAETYYPRLHLGWSELRSLVDARWQYIEGRRRELYDVRADPRQTADALAAHAEVGRERQKELAAFPAGLSLPAEVGGEEREKLAALGYLGGAARPSGPLPDPRESLPALAQVKAGFRLAAAGKDVEAVAALRSVLERFPHLFDARFELGQALVRLGRYQEAYDAFRAALDSSPALAAPVALALGRVCLQLGRLDEAQAHARVALGASAAPARELLARIALERDDLAGAEREALAVGGDDAAEARAAVVLAEVRIRQQRFAEAIAIVESAQRAQREGGLAPARDLDFLRGDALARLGRHAEAQAAFEAEVRAFPANSQAWARLAVIYGIRGRSVREVDRLLEAMVAANPAPATRELAAKTLESMGDPRGARLWRGRAAAVSRH